MKLKIITSFFVVLITTMTCCCCGDTIRLAVDANRESVKETTITATTETQQETTTDKSDTYKNTKKNSENETKTSEKDNLSDTHDVGIVADSTDEEQVQIEEIQEVQPEVSQDSSQEPDIYSMDVWTLGSHLYGISELDTTRTLVLISYEGYGGSPLSYYVACCCWVRATEGYWGYGNLYSAFGEIDSHYGEWMDSLGYSDYAIDALRECYLSPTYVRYCNGMTVPSSWVYEEGGIYVW